MEINLVEEGIKFMFLGMGIVFVFLVFMIGVLKLQAQIISKYFPEPKKIDPVKKNDDKKVVAAISAAIMHYKNSK